MKSSAITDETDSLATYLLEMLLDDEKVLAAAEQEVQRCQSKYNDTKKQVGKLRHIIDMVKEL